MRPLNRSGVRRSGDDYQDLLALELVVDWLEHPDRYQWIRLEANDFAGSLDDVTALRLDGKFVARQIKWTSDPNAHQLSWDWILEKNPNKPKRKSLLEKWSESFFSLCQNYECKEAALYTNRQIEGGFAQLLDERGLICLDNLARDTKTEIISQIGSEEKFTEFLTSFHFNADHPDHNVKRESLFRRFQGLGGDQQGFNNLLNNVREWAKLKNNPIVLEEIRRAARWNVLEDIHQGFHIPESYVLPSNDFHNSFKQRLLVNKEPLTVLKGAPGVGKSTYLSFVKNELESEDVHVVRHHYYLSQDDATGDRYSWSIVSQSLMSQIQENCCSFLTDIAHRNPDPKNIGEWLDQCGTTLKNEGKPFVVIIDGLDHVYRDRNTTDPLLGMVDNLFPVPENVVLVLGTRDVDDAYFPQKFLDESAENVWFELPFMNKNAVRGWIEFHAAQVGILGGTQQRDYQLDALSEALFQKTNGYPLHLTYTLQALLDMGQGVNDTNIAALPACPNNDIKQYYDRLMHSLDESGQIMLHIICACGFKWPNGALTECLNPTYGTIPDIKKTENKIHHLLRIDRMGLNVYHVSLEEYVRSLPAHSAVLKQAYPLVINWLEGKAPVLWRWSYLWIIKNKNDEENPLINGPTEEWLADALLKGYPVYQIEDILKRAAWAALDKGNLVRTLQLSLMGEYARSATEFQTNGLQRLLFCQLQEGWSDSNLKTRLLSEPYLLGDEELALCAETFSQNDQIENVRVFKDFFESESFVDKPSNQFGRNQERRYDTHYLDIIASLKPEDANKLLDWVRKFDKGRMHYTKHLQRLASLNATTALQNIAKSDLEPKEAWVTARSLHHFASHQSVRISSWELCDQVKKIPVMQVRFFIEGVRDEILCFYEPDTEIFNQSYRELYGPQPELTGFYHDVFFSCLFLYLQAVGPFEDIWLKRLDVHGWVMAECARLADAAKSAADKIQDGDIPDAAWFYTQFENVDVPRNIHHSQEGTYCRYLQLALVDISYDLQLLSGKKHLETKDVKAIVVSKHFRKEKWLENIIDLRVRDFLCENALKWFCEQEEQELFETIKPFNERYEDYMRLAQICTLHGQSEFSEKYAILAVQDALAVNFHKDSFLFGLSDIVLDCAKAGIEESKDWLSKIGPFIDQVTECTDGDETDHVQLDFGEALLHIQPEKFSAFYKRYIDEEEWYRSDNLLSRFKSNVDADDPLNRAIFETYIERKDREYSSSSDFNDREVEPIDFSVYPPDRMEDFLNDLDQQNRIFNKDFFQGWFDHWSVQSGQKPRILEAMRAIACTGTDLPFRTGGFYDRMLLLAQEVAGKSQAYETLLQAHQAGYGWSVHYGREDAEERFCLIAQLWPEKWLDFIKDTALSRRAYSREQYPPSIGLSRLVQYLLIIGEHDLVVQVGNMLTNFTLERCKNMAFPESPWVEATDNQYGFIPLLFHRLDWPDVNVRKEACQQILTLLQNNQFQKKIKDYYWLWLSTRVFESQCVTSVVLFYKCHREDRSIFDDEDLEKLIASIPVPSTLSWMLLTELKGAPLDPKPLYSNLHSGNAPCDYEIPDYFTDYKTALLPPVYDMRIDALQGKGAFGFRRQWAYEITCLYDRENIETRYPYAHYFIDHGIQKRFSSFDLPQSEVFRSGYLRALAWAFDNEHIDQADLMWNAMEFCPVEFCSWQAKPIEKPDFWPQIENTSEDIDQTPEQVFQSLEKVLSIDRDAEYLIGSASGPITVDLENYGDVEIFYDLEIYGLFQKNVEHDGDVNPEEVVEQIRQIESIHAKRLTSNLEGPLPFIDINEKLATSAGASFAPSVFALRAAPIARWQNEQMYRGINIAAPYLAEDQPMLVAMNNKLQLDSGDIVLSETGYWSFDQLDYWPQDCPAPLGVYTNVSKERIQSFCDLHRVSFCWLAQLTFYQKKERSEAFLKKKFYKFYGLSPIILSI